ncbi:peptidogalycan biosysnthesis protein [Streptomyces sp. NPDC002055]|uniref:peptidogalycan biosysnthesis protein n=1 Tax=Streptomyces sp. NPDC002055 TaxID=3154534 RepID=UPI00332A8046
MGNIGVLRSVDEVPAGEWEELTEAADIDSARGFLQFREYQEPGDSVLFTARSAGRLRGALRGVMAVPRSGATSDPWKFIGSDAVLRPADGEREDETADLRRDRRALVHAAAGEPAGAADTPLWQLLTDGVGPALVVREFDRSELWCHPGADRAEAADLAARLLRAAQTEAVERGAGAVALPFVSPRDTLLREVLTEAGFRGGAMTGASWLDTAGRGSYEEFLAGLPARRRRYYRTEEERLHRAPGLSTGEADPVAHARRIGELEAQTLIKHGGTADAEAIGRARIEIARRLPEAVRIPVVERDGRIVACAMHLAGRRSVVFMTYGCDYGVEDRGASYPWAAFYYPVRTAVAGGATAVRLGLEGFEAKTRRGARVEARELWVWTPRASARGPLGDLLDLVGARNTAYLRRFSD